MKEASKLDGDSYQLQKLFYGMYTWKCYRSFNKINLLAVYIKQELQARLILNSESRIDTLGHA